MRFRFGLISLLGSFALLCGCGGVTSSTAPSEPGTTTPPPVTQPVAAFSVTTYHYDNARSGLNSQETTLTPANVNIGSFGKLFSFTVDGEIYGQPLYVPNVSIGGSAHNVVYVATEHDGVFAFDADGKTTSPLWQQSFINPAAGVTTVNSNTDFPQANGPYDDIYPEIGITSTPVIDASTGTMYVVAKTKENGKYIQRLHALDIATGAEKFNGPVAIQASMPGQGVVNDGKGNIVFDPYIGNQRSALLLLNGTVYLAFASHGDFDPFLGWVLGYDAQTLQQKVVFAPTPDGAGGGIWESGDGPAADAAGNIFLAVSNGDYTAYSGGRDYGDSALKLQPSNGTLNVQDWFTPFDFQQLNDLDHDLGSGGAILLPDQVSGPAHLMVAGGKGGQLYVINRDNMGKNHVADNNQIVQQIALPGPLFGVPAAWGNRLYVQSLKGPMQCYANNGGQFTATSNTGQTFGYPGSSPAVSSNGSSSGIVWTLDATAWDNGPAVLHAYDATDCSKELYNSAQNGSRDTAGTAVKFSVPTIANGKVYVSGDGTLTVYGLLK
jgi:hypothetical protein